MKTIPFISLSISLTAFPLLAIPAEATPVGMSSNPVIFDNGGALSGGLGLVSDAGAAPTAVIADDFILSPGQTTITDYHWSGAYLNSPLGSEPMDNFTILILDDLNGSPNNVVEVPVQFSSVDRQLTGEFLGSGQQIYEYWIEPGNLVELMADTPYWIAIFNETPGGEWVWAQSDDTGNAFINFDSMLDPSAWQELDTLGVPSEMAFNLTGPSAPTQVPEPGIAMGILLVGSMMASRKIKPNKN